jgi:hypothetical protein
MRINRRFTVKSTWTAAALASVLFVTACSSSDDTADEPPVESTTSSTTTTLAPTTTVTPSSTTSSTSTSTTTTTTLVPADPEELLGLWDVRGGDILTFDEDGSYALYVELGDDPFDSGTYTFDGVTLVMTGVEDSSYCPGEVGSYTVQFPDEVTADIDAIDDPCGQRRNGITFGLTRHDPDS